MAKLLTLLALLGSLAWAQPTGPVGPQPGPTVIIFPADPSGACPPNNLANVTADGTLWYCPASTRTWTQVTAGGGGGPTGPAGGQLSGTYPNPSIVSSVALAGAPTTPTPTQGDSSTQITNDAYIASALASINPPAVVQAATTGVLSNTPTYSNGTAGVGATLTAGSNGVLTIDGYNPVLNDRVLIKNQAAGLQNGVYTLTTVGTGGVPYVLTRAVDYNSVQNINYSGEIGVLQGSTNGCTGWTLSSLIATVGTSALNYSQTSTGCGNLAPNGNVKAQGNLPNGDAIQGAGGKTITDSGVTITNLRTRALGYSFGDAATGAALTTSEIGYITVPFSCTITGYHIMADGGTATLKTYRVNGGTAVPTSGNSISTSGVSLSSGTKIDSTTVSDFTSTAIAKNDTLGFAITTVATAKQITFQLDCQN